MLVYLVRHAIAEERDPNGHDDAARRLTRRGIDRMKENVVAMKSMGVGFDTIWTSPLVRARETADLLEKLLRRGGEMVVVDELASSIHPMAIPDRLARLDGVNAIALVGHEPDMGDLGSLLLFGRSSHALRFKKGGVACIEFGDVVEPGTGVLHWMLTPRQMRAIA